MSDQPGEPHGAGSGSAAPQPTAGTGPLPPELQASAASKDDRTLAMIAHLLGLVGFLGPLVLYLLKKEGASAYVRFHMKQSLFYQVAVSVVMVGLMLVTIIGMAVTQGLVGCVLFPIIFLAVLGDLVYIVMAVVQTANGKDFEYYWIGPWVRRSMM